MGPELTAVLKRAQVFTHPESLEARSSPRTASRSSDTVVVGSPSDHRIVAKYPSTGRPQADAERSRSQKNGGRLT